MLEFFFLFYFSFSSREDFVKDTATSVNLETDNNLWMKDYSKPNSNSNKLDLFDLSKKNSNMGLNAVSDLVQVNNSNNFNSVSVGSMNTSRSGKHIDILEIYKGMSYEEWTKIRDTFLKSHNMI